MTRAKAELANRQPLRALWRLVASIRFDEVIVLQGAPLLGALFALESLAFDRLAPLALLVAGNLLLVAHVFVLNDWAGIQGDLRDPNRAARTFAARRVERGSVGWLAVALLVGALAVLAQVGDRALAIALAIAGLSALYSLPGIHWKGRPLLGSALHLAGGLLHFLLGYASFAPVDARGVWIGGFFALVFTAGHVSNEVRDHAGDAANGIRTNAVAFGRRAAFLASQGLFVAAYLLLALLALEGLLPPALTLVAALAVPHLAAALRAWREGLDFAAVRRLQRCYRALFALIGLVMAAAALPW